MSLFSRGRGVAATTLVAVTAVTAVLGASPALAQPATTVNCAGVYDADDGRVGRLFRPAHVLVQVGPAIAQLVVSPSGFQGGTLYYDSPDCSTSPLMGYIGGGMPPYASVVGGSVYVPDLTVPLDEGVFGSRRVASGACETGPFNALVQTVQTSAAAPVFVPPLRLEAEPCAATAAASIDLPSGAAAAALLLGAGLVALARGRRPSAPGPS